MEILKKLKLSLGIFFMLSLVSNVHSQHEYYSNDDGYHIIADSSGFHSKDHNFNIEELLPKNTWEGEWIWLNQTEYIDYQSTQTEWRHNPEYKRQYKALFRKSFELTEVPDRSYLSLTADIAFRFYINGIFVAQGPPDTGNDYFDGVPPEHRFYTTHNVNEFLKSGINTIAVEVFSHFREISETSSGQGMFICDLMDGNKRCIVATDTTWKCNIDTSFQIDRGNYTCNNNFEISGWNSEFFEDNGWKNSSAKNVPKKGYLVNSMMPVPFRSPVKPQRLWYPGNEIPISDYSATVFNKELQDVAFTLDFGKNLTAFYGFEVLANKNDTLKIYPYEKKYASQNRALLFICKEGLNVFYAPFLSVFRYLRVEVKSQKGLIIKDIHTDFSSYPVDYRGNFSCSDQSLTKLWDITRWTTQLCMNDMFYDSPKHQEPIACTGDYFIQSLINFYAFGDPWLTRQTLLKTAWLLEKNNYDMFHTSYSLLWVQMLYQYYQYTGDIQLVKELVPHVNKLNQLFETYLDSSFLVSNAPDYMFMDWIKIDKFNAHHPPAVIGMGYMTALYYKSLLDAANLNRLVDNKLVQGKNLKLAKKIKRAMNDFLWDQEKQLFKDGIPFRNKKENHYFFPADTNIVTYSPHVNTLAVLYGIAPKNHQHAILDYIINQKTIDLQPYFMFFVLSAVEHTGHFNTIGLELLKKWEKGVDHETFTLKENWQDVTDTGYGGDYSHAWGGSPLYFMSRNILGVKPGIPGFKEIEISPFINDKIHWAKGRIPLTQGNNLEINWKRENDKKYVFTIEIPDNFKAFMVIPENPEIRNFQINHKKYPKSLKRIQLVSGNYEIEFDNKK